MSAHIVCVTSGGGLPLFSRKKGNSNSLPFSVIGSLNGVHMFGKSQQVELLNTVTEDYTVSWREFHDSLVIIGISSGCTLEILKNTIQSIFNAVVLIVGIDEVKAQRNIERLKRELRICYPVIDRLLDSLDCGDSSSKHSSDLIGMVETILCIENHSFQILLDSFTECIDSLFSCLLIHGKIAAATESWWSLHVEEIKLLSLLATTENSSISKDIPVFLPYKSSNVAFRFVCWPLTPEVQLCCLCGPNPTLLEIENFVSQCFKNSGEMINSAMQCHPRNFPSNYQIDTGVLGILLYNCSYGKYMITRNPQQNSSKKAASSSHRFDILRTFFYQSVNTFLIPKDDQESQYTSASETYWCSEYHKCYAMKTDDNIISVLFSSNIPNYAMKLITENTLKTLIGDKQLGW